MIVIVPHDAGATQATTDGTKTANRRTTKVVLAKVVS